MIEVFEHETMGWNFALYGMRNPMSIYGGTNNSWDKSDSYIENGEYVLGPNDMDLACKLVKSGSEHRKLLRAIHIQANILAPDYFTKEMDTYKVGVTRNSSSTMHRLTSKPFTRDDFSHDQLTEYGLVQLDRIIDDLNGWRDLYLKDKDKGQWYQIVQLLPMSYNYFFTLDFNYENALTMIHQRSGHKLNEWHQFVEFLLGLPYMERFYKAMKGE